ncbi:MAG: hypothetical protein ACO3A4_12810 [Silvanigrellaceae bacterium]
MSQRVDAIKFISELQSAKENPRLKIVLTDNSLIRKLIADRLHRLAGVRPQLFSGKSAVQEAVESLSTGDLFGEPAPAWIELSEKMSAKQWTEAAGQFSLLSEPARQELFVLAPAANRHGAPEAKALPWNAEVLVIYEPQRSEGLEILAMLAPRHGQVISQAGKSQIQQWCIAAYEHYSADLEACDLHFERMAKGHLAFEAAFVAKTSLDAFDLVEAFSTGDISLVHLRMAQLEQTGEDTSSILSVFAYTGRQVVAFQSALAKTGNVRSAHEQVKTPYPSQARIERLAKLVSTDKWARFFLAAAELELRCRNQRDAHSWLAVELTGLLS